MADKKISDYLREPRTSSTAAQNHLRQLVERYPYFHAARLVYLRLLFQSHDPSFGSELRKAALYIPSRQVLYQMIEGQRFNPAQIVSEQKAHHKKSGEDADRTASLIGQFLDTVSVPQPRRPQKVDATVDYIEYLRQSGGDSDVLLPAKGASAGAAEHDAARDVIDAFLDGGAKLEIHERGDEEIIRPETADNEEQGSDVLTEMMAKIYIKQGKYDKALEIIRRLSLKNPKKNRYFADQMRFLQKIIINNKNK